MTGTPADGSGHRLHPDVAAIRAAVRSALADVEPGGRLLVGCSGGADSMALAAATTFEGARAGWQVGAVVIDHGLQPDSAEVAQAVSGRVASLGCSPVSVVRVEVGRAGGPEAAARTARYAALAKAAADSDALIVLGHTRDDQAETVLLGLARGSGLRSLAGMSPAAGVYRRPLLAVSRAQTRAACQALHLTVWDDPHNTDTAFARVRVRTEALPMLERTLGPGVSEALARTALLARADAEALDQIAARLRADATVGDGSLDLGHLLDVPPALVSRVLRQAAVRAGAPPGELSAVHVVEMYRLLTDWHGQRGVDLPGHVRVRRESGRLLFDRRETS